jgi:hypothetical protein
MLQDGSGTKVETDPRGQHFSWMVGLITAL